MKDFNTLMIQESHQSISPMLNSEAQFWIKGWNVLPLNGAGFHRSVWIECKWRKSQKGAKGVAVLSCHYGVSWGTVRKAELLDAKWPRQNSDCVTFAAIQLACPQRRILYLSLTDGVKLTYFSWCLFYFLELWLYILVVTSILIFYFNVLARVRSTLWRFGFPFSLLWNSGKSVIFTTPVCDSGVVWDILMDFIDLLLLQKQQTFLISCLSFNFCHAC